MLRPLAVVFAVLALTSCGVIYVPSDVSDTGSDVAVRVVSMTGESVLLANRATQYEPRSLPSAFSQTAGTGAGMRGIGAFPESPFEPETRPSALQLRIPPAANPGPYRIGVGDLLVLATPSGGGSVAELSGLLAAQNRRQGYTVQDDGMIMIPDVGRVNVGGLTQNEAEAEVFGQLVQNQIDPSFSLEVAEFNSQRVSIGGAVRNPSLVPVGLTPVVLNEVITIAGGITAQDREFATIRIYRDGELYQIPLSRFDQEDSLQRLRLVDGDSIFVDTEYRLDRAEAYYEQQIRVADMRSSRRAAALSELQAEVGLRRQELSEVRGNFSARDTLGAVERDYVYLTGQVGQQTRFPLPFEATATLADALFEADGIAEGTGNPAQIYVLRASPDPRDFGAVTAWHLNGSNAVNLVLATRMELRPGDIIFIAEQPVTRWNRVVQQIIPSLSVANSLSN